MVKNYSCTKVDLDDSFDKITDEFIELLDKITDFGILSSLLET